MAIRNPKICYVVVGLEVRAPSEDMKVAERVDSLIGKKPEYDSLAFNNRRDQSKSEKRLFFNSHSEWANTEQIEWQVLRERWVRFFQRSDDSNPGRLGGKRECFLCAMPSLQEKKD